MKLGSCRAGQSRIQTLGVATALVPRNNRCWPQFRSPIKQVAGLRSGTLAAYWWSVTCPTESSVMIQRMRLSTPFRIAGAALDRVLISARQPTSSCQTAYGDWGRVS